MSVLIVGGGKMGMSHLALVTQYVGKPNVALCDSKRSIRLFYRLLGFRTFSSVDVALERLGKINGVLIATPTPSHASLVRWAIEQRIPAFVEKPLTLNTKVSRELVTLADETGIEVFVGFVMRHIATFQRLQQLIQGGELGTIISYTAVMRGNVMTEPPSPNSWVGDFTRGGGCLNEYGAHILDLCRFIFGSVRSVDEAQMTRIYCEKADDRIETDCTHENGAKGRIEIDWCDPTKRKSTVEVRAVFEHAEIRVDNSAFEIMWRGIAPIAQERRAELGQPEMPRNVGFNLRGEEFSLEIEAFLSRCLGRNLHVDPRPSIDATARLRDGYEVDRMIDEIARKVGMK